METRRDFFRIAAAAAALDEAAFAELRFPDTRPDRGLFPCPANGATAGVNPPGFGFWRVQGAAGYKVTVLDAAGNAACESETVPDPVWLPGTTLRPGKYRWDVSALDSRGNSIARRGEWRFTIPQGAPELPWVDPKELLARMPPGHPRHVYLEKDLGRIRETLASTRREAWESLRASANKALKAPLPEPPKYHTFEGKNRQRMGYKVYFGEFRRRLDATLPPLALAWLLSGEERYGARAKQILLEVEPWGIEGPMSLLSPFGDEPGLSMSRYGHRAYDWLYAICSDGERQRIREMTAGRARQILKRLRRADYLARPSESHNGRLIAYLAEHAVVLRDEAPDSAEWLDYSLRGLTTFYPHWGDTDGGWAEGVSYALAYNNIYLGALESLRAAAGFDLYKRPFFRSVRKFFLYCTSPIGEMRPFGDGSNSQVSGSGASSLLLHHGRRFGDPVSVWWAKQAGGSGGQDPFLSLITEDTVAAAPPVNEPSAAVFRGIGWAAMLSDLDKPEQDTFFLLQSSPFGSVSHSHADQNTFAILKGGAALAIPSGYYGPAYGMPHHDLWTRQTKANNGILVNGAGQDDRSADAQGKIAQFRHQKMLTYARGDAAQAYGGKLPRFLRHVLFLRPGLFAVLDELEAPQPAEFQWLLHALDKMQVDQQAGTVTSARKGATLTVKLVSDTGLTFSQTDAFDTPYNEGNPPEYHEQLPNHWHFKASTREKLPATRIAAVMVVRGAGEDLRTEWREQPGWVGLRLTGQGGSGEIWAQTTPGKPGPAFAGGSILAGRWNDEVLRVFTSP